MVPLKRLPRAGRSWRANENCGHRAMHGSVGKCMEVHGFAWERTVRKASQSKARLCKPAKAKRGHASQHATALYQMQLHVPASCHPSPNSTAPCSYSDLLGLVATRLVDIVQDGHIKALSARDAPHFLDQGLVALPLAREDLSDSQGP
eukprot:UN1936